MSSAHHGGDLYGYQNNNMSASSRTASYQRPYGQQHQHQHPSVDAFTAEMRDRQARGKDPYQDSEDSSDPNHWGGRRRTKDEPFAVVEKRRQAAQILDTPELLMMNAQRDNDSIPATRLRFTRMLCGVEEPAPPSSQRGSSSKAPSSPHHGSKSRTHTPSKRHSSLGGGRGAR